MANDTQRIVLALSQVALAVMRYEQATGVDCDPGVRASTVAALGFQLGLRTWNPEAVGAVMRGLSAYEAAEMEEIARSPIDDITPEVRRGNDEG